MNGPRIKQLRHKQGHTAKQTATTAHINPNTWRNWETGTVTPRLWRAPVIASALGVPVEALFLPDGWAAVTAVNLTPEACERVRRLGVVEAERVADLVRAQLPALILEAVRPLPVLKPGDRPKRRRTRVEVLAGIAEANRMRAARFARQDPEPPA